MATSDQRKHTKAVTKKVLISVCKHKLSLQAYEGLLQESLKQSLLSANVAKCENSGYVTQ